MINLVAIMLWLEDIDDKFFAIYDYQIEYFRKFSMKHQEGRLNV